jgi:hypothetical protein
MNGGFDPTQIVANQRYFVVYEINLQRVLFGARFPLRVHKMFMGKYLRFLRGKLNAQASRPGINAEALN